MRIQNVLRIALKAIRRNKISGGSTLWTAHNFEVNASGVGQTGGGRNGSRWYEIGSLTSVPALVQSGTLFDPAGTNPFGYWMPSVAASGQGHMVLGSSRASADAASGFAGIAAAGRFRTDALGTTQSAMLAQSSTATYNVGSGIPKRWGDYSQVGVDPTDDMTMWTFQEYANATNSWGVRAIQLKAPPPATPDCTTPALVTHTTQDVTIPGTSVSGSEFFDPGPDTGGPGYANHLQASVSGGVTVHSATFDSPTSVTLNVTVTTDGLKDVTITNPDGQSVAGSNCINVALAPPADLSITKTDGQATAVPGTSITYTIVASNAGPNIAIGATVTDAVPAAIMGATWTCAGNGGGTCTPAGAGSIDDTVDLPVGATVTYTLTGMIDPAATSPLANTATVAAPASVNDPNPGNDSATDTDTLLFACGTEIIVVPDGRLTPAVIPAVAPRWFRADVKIGNSYSVEFKNASGDGTPPGALTVLSGDDGCTGMSSLATNDTSTFDPPGAPATVRASFTMAGTASFARMRLVNGSGSSIAYSFGLSDTTMYGPAWSTNGSFDTFYSLQNTTGSSLDARLTLFDTAGAQLSTFNLTIPAGQTTSTNTAALAVMRDRTGTARLTHNGPPGAILAEAAIANFTITPAYIQPVKMQTVREAR